MYSNDLSEQRQWQLGYGPIAVQQVAADLGVFWGVRDYLGHFHSHDISNESGSDRDNLALARIALGGLLFIHVPYSANRGVV